MSSPAFGESVSALSIIKHILANYPFSGGIFREFLQNSDDAKASEQVFVLDCRTHPSEKLCNPALACLQGPALLAFNGARFEDDDWIAVRTISDSSKKQDTSKIGKFGIGLRSAYHITDNLTILSGDKLLIFDPQQELIRGGGTELSLTENVAETIDHFRPFDHFLGSAWSGGPFDGTVIRLPLRTAPGEIRDKVVTANEIEQLFDDFMAPGELDIAMLFLNHLRSIKFVKIGADGVTQDLGSCLIDIEELQDGVFQKTVTVQPGVSVSKQQWLVTNSRFSVDEASDLLCERTENDRAHKLVEKHKLNPIVGLAFPLDSNCKRDCGYLFTFLRLPLRTGFPVHIHALFALAPSRQNMRNPEDNGLVKGSEDDFLRQWNKILFEVFIPRAWSGFLGTLVELFPSTSAFEAWPPQQTVSKCGESMYWNYLSQGILRNVVAQGIAIWPIVGQSTYGRLQDLFIAEPEIANKVVDAFVSLGLLITRPPPFVVTLLKQTDQSAMTWLTPETAAAELKKRVASLVIAPSLASTVLEYLLSTRNINNIVSIPIVHTLSGSLVALQSRQCSSTRHTLLEGADADVFADCDGHAIGLRPLSKIVASLLRGDGPQYLNVDRLDVARVLQYLAKKGFSAPRLDIAENDLTFLNAFWLLIADWDRGPSLLPQIATQFLLPCSNGLQRPVADDVVFSAPEGGGTPCTVLSRALESLGVPVLVSSATFGTSARAVLRRKKLLKDWDDIHALLNSFAKRTLVTVLPQPDAQRLLRHIINHSLGSTVNRGQFDAAQQRTLKNLPIFPLVSTSDDGKDITSWTCLGSQDVYGVMSVDILPRLPNTAFLQLGSFGVDTRFLNSIGATSGTRECSDMDVLALALDRNVLPVQPPAVLAKIMEHLQEHSQQLTPQLRSLLKKQKIVFAANGERSTPEDLIDHSNPMYNFYTNEPSRIPHAPDDDDVQASILHSASELQLFESSITPNIVEDRIQWMSKNADDPSMVSASIAFLELLDGKFDFTPLAQRIRSMRWLPSHTGVALVAPDSSWPTPPRSEELFLFNQVFTPIYQGIAIPSSIKRAYGWDKPVPVAELLKQLRLTLTPAVPIANVEKCRRMIALLKEFGSRGLDGQQIEELRSALDSKEWVPVIGYTLVAPSNAVFQHPFPDAGIHAIDSAMADDRYVSLLKSLGCMQQPSLDTIITALHRLQAARPTYATASRAVSLLKFADAARLALTKEKTALLLVPDDGNCLRPSSEVVFNDIGDRALMVPRDNLHIAGKGIDGALARSLHLELLGIRYMGLDDPSEDMGASPLTLVQKVIGQYTEKQFATEFLANAEDAGAKRFSILLTESASLPRFGPARGLLGGTEKFYECPSVLVYNDKVFSDKDFEGICRTHLGSKADNPDSIGQFGQGALTMFHFAEIAIIISGAWILFMDPSKCHLPFNGRASYKLPLANIATLYPGHLVPLQQSGLFKLEADNTFSGTLFMLPLRTEAHCRKAPVAKKLWCPTSFRQRILDEFRFSAPQSLLFTGLERIEVQSRASPSAAPASEWSASARRGYATQGCFELVNSMIREDSPFRPTEARWLTIKRTIQRSDVPEEFKSHGIKHVRVGLSACLEPSGTPPGKFFSTLPLAIGTSLPVHVNASFVLSSDRRQIRHDTLGGVQTKFNQYLLSDPLPQAYLALLEELGRDSQNNARWWPGCHRYSATDKDGDYPMDTNDDALTDALIKSFYSQHLPASTHQLFPQFYPASDRPAMRFDEVIIYPRGLAESVKKLLDNLRPGTVCKLSIRSLNLERSKLRVMKATDVKGWITVCQAAPRIRNPSSGVILYDLLEYLGCDDPLNLCGLEFLPLADGTWTTFCKKDSGLPKYIASSFTIDRLIELFPASHFVQDPIPIPSSLLRKLIEAGVNVAPFDASATKTLVQESLRMPSAGPARRQEWIRLFWESYPYLPLDGRDRQVIEDLPLVCTALGSHISLTRCKKGDVLLATSAVFAPDFLAASFNDFGIVMVRTDSAPLALKAILESPEFSPSGTPFVTSFLRSIKSRTAEVNQQLDQWTQDRRQEFSEWMIAQAMSRMEDDVRDTAKRLKIWPARRLGVTEWHSALDVRLLPHTLNMNAARFLTIPVTDNAAAYRFEIERMSVQDIKARLQLPSRLAEEDDRTYQDILRAVIGVTDHRGGSPMVPNARRTMVHSKTLYARQTLFEAAFGADSDKFLLRSFSEFDDALRNRQLLKHTGQLDMTMFVECAQALHNDRSVDKVRRAQVLFRVYSEDLPFHVGAGSGAQAWQQVEHLRFVPRNISTNKQYGLWTLPIPLRITQLPEVVSPAELIKSEFHDVAWTQRAMFAVEPDNRVQVAYHELGSPSAEEVVSHLRDLVNLRKGDDVLHYLKQTYGWLTANIDDAAGIIQRFDEPIFLNVDNPKTDEWRWARASEMAFENHGVQHIQVVGTFMLQYKALLKAAGVIDVQYPTMSIQPAPEDSDEGMLKRMREGFAEMRAEGDFTDVAFYSKEDEWIDEEARPMFRAHRNYLAVFSSYFKNMFTGPWPESGQASSERPLLIPLEHSRFAIKAVLEYLYTGKVISPEQSDNVLEDLLQVIELSQYLDVRSLFENTQREIVRKKLIGPLTLEDVQARADNVNATTLKQYCVSYGNVNRDYVRKINSA